MHDSSQPSPAAATQRPTRPGRSSRRRKRKARSIFDAADVTAQPSSAVPTDRGTTLQGVHLRRRQERQRRSSQLHPDPSHDAQEQSLDPTDERHLLSQLGFLPGNAVGIAARLSPEFLLDAPPVVPPPPSVLQLYPMAVRESYRGGKSDGRKFKSRRRGFLRAEPTTPASDRGWRIPSASGGTNIVEPFPTLYWLTSPRLRSCIGRLELSATHNVSRMEERLRSSPEHLERMAKAHESYGKRRWELLTEEDREELLRRGWGEALDGGRGVAGIRPSREGVWDGVKCLHAHAAHFLAQLEEWREEKRESDGSGVEEERLSVWIRECDREDLNLVGKWTMEAVLDLLPTDNRPE